MPVQVGNVTVPLGTQDWTEYDFWNKGLTDETSQYNNYDWLSERVILAAKNDTVGSIN